MSPAEHTSTTDMIHQPDTYPKHTEFMDIFWLLILLFLAARLMAALFANLIPEFQKIRKARGDGYGFVRITANTLVGSSYLFYAAAVFCLISEIALNR